MELDIRDKKLFGCMENGNLTRIAILDYVEEIWEGAFKQCVYLEDAIIQKSVEKIGKKSFSWCTSLKNLTIPKSVKEIWEYAFICCWNLFNITIGESIFDKLENRMKLFLFLAVLKIILLVKFIIVKKI